MTEQMIEWMYAWLKYGYLIWIINDISNKKSTGNNISGKWWQQNISATAAISSHKYMCHMRKKTVFIRQHSGSKCQSSSSKYCSHCNLQIAKEARKSWFETRLNLMFSAEKHCVVAVFGLLSHKKSTTTWNIIFCNILPRI